MKFNKDIANPRMASKYYRELINKSNSQGNIYTSGSLKIGKDKGRSPRPLSPKP